jgi:tetratricopeptide (TPR) repeat protein
MMRMAQDAMKNMKPEQIQALQSQMANMDPATMQAQMRAAQQMMGNMSPEQMRDQMSQATAQINNLTPEQLAQQTKAAQAQLASQASYVVAGATALKEEGNTLHREGKYAEAAAKYQAAKKGIEGDDSPAAVQLRQSCCLNLASCYLKSGKHSLVVRESGIVAKADPTNLKALYRRGQAYAAMGRLSQAKADLAAAVRHHPGDEHVGKALGEVMLRIENGEPDVEEPEEEEEAEPETADVGGGLAALAAAMKSGSEEEGKEEEKEEAGETASKKPPPAPAASDAPALSKAELLQMSLKELRDLCKQRGLDYQGCLDKLDLVQVVLDNKKAAEVPEFAKAASMTPAAAAAAAANVAPDDQVNMAMKMMQDDAMMSQASSMMKSMSPEALAAMFNARGPGPGGRPWTPEMAKMQADMMGNPEQIAAARRMMSSMSPDQLKQAVAGQMGTLGAAGAGGGASAMAADGLTKDPEALKKAATQMKSMDPDAMAKLMETQSRGMGMNISPEMAKMSAQMMSNMSPEQLSSMMEQASAMGMGPGGMGAMGAAGGMGAADGMGAAGGPPKSRSGGIEMPEITPEMSKQAASMMRDPEMVKQMTSMMRNMDPALLKQFGIDDPAQLDKAAEQLEKLSPEQLERLMSWGTYLQGALLWFRRNPWVKYAGGALGAALLYYTLGAWLLPASLLPAGWRPAPALDAAASDGARVAPAPPIEGRVGEAVAELDDDDDDSEGGGEGAEAGAVPAGGGKHGKGGAAFFKENAEL